MQTRKQSPRQQRPPREGGGLVISRDNGQRFFIDTLEGRIEVRTWLMHGRKIRHRIVAPDSARIYREEIAPAAA
jgi:sRNA-binding carbon storage regulator CsrA